MIISLLLLPLIGVLMLLPLGNGNLQKFNLIQLNKLCFFYLILLFSQFLKIVPTVSRSEGNEKIINFVKSSVNASDNKNIEIKGFNNLSKNLSITNITENELMKKIALFVSLLNLLISIYMWFQFDYNTTSYQFVYEFNNLNFCHFHVGVDGISLYFVLLTTFITPICILSN